MPESEMYVLTMRLTFCARDKPEALQLGDAMLRKAVEIAPPACAYDCEVKAASNSGMTPTAGHLSP